MDKTFAIIQNRCRGIIDPFNRYNDCIFEVFKKQFKVKRGFLLLLFIILKKIHFIKYGLQSIYWNKEWKKKVKQFDNWIIFYDNSAKMIVQYIKKKNPSARCFIYSWDIHFIPEKEVIYDGVGTFDPLQAVKYNITYYSQFFCINDFCIELLAKRKHIYGADYKFVYLGLKKDREKDILNIKELCDTFSTNSFFRIVDSNYTNRMHYLDYLAVVLSSDCIIDIIQEGQSGLTLRPMEALFLGKKLITNNTYIRNMDFYDTANIFIYGQDKNLEKFMKTPKKTVPEYIRSRYTFENFVQRIILLETKNVESNIDL